MRTFLIGRPFRHKDITGDADSPTVCGHAVARIAAAVLHDTIDADGLGMGNQDCSAAILEESVGMK